MTQALLAPGAAPVLRGRVRADLAPLPTSALLLDVGCGAVSRLAEAGAEGRVVVGVEIDPARATAFRRGGGAAVLASAPRLPFAAGTFDAAWCFGLLHHLDDGAAAAAVREMRRVTRAGGATVVFDSVWPEPAWREPLAWAVRCLDRGRWVRRQADLEALLPGREDWTCERFRYARNGLEGLWCTARSRGSSW